MPSLMERIRSWLHPVAGHTAEHADVQRRLAHQQLRIARLDADLDARRAAKERRRISLPGSPRRRAGDA